jgi:hypothetical protein
MSSSSLKVVRMTTAIFGGLAQFFDGGDAVHAGHAQVHQHHVGAQGRAQLQGFGPVRCFADQVQVVLGFEDEAQALADDEVVVSD